MIKVLQKADIERVVDIWLDTNLKAHYFIPGQYWKDNIDFVPVNTVPVTYTTLTANFDYYLVYNVTKKEYNNISNFNEKNEFWYLSYSSSSNLLIGINFIN